MQRPPMPWRLRAMPPPRYGRISPRLLGRRILPASGMLADRFARGCVLDAFCRNTLAAILAECDIAIARGTQEVIVLQETGWGPDGPIYSPEATVIRSSDAAELVRIRQLLETTRVVVDRTLDLIAGEEAVRTARS